MHDLKKLETRDWQFSNYDMSVLTCSWLSQLCEDSYWSYGLPKRASTNRSPCRCMYDAACFILVFLLLMVRVIINHFECFMRKTVRVHNCPHQASWIHNECLHSESQTWSPQKMLPGNFSPHLSTFLTYKPGTSQFSPCIHPVSNPVWLLWARSEWLIVLACSYLSRLFTIA